ncbi:AT-hook motif nuclear-localised protein [Parasponia andersonii]|uniref:AT-hook motif nuclear-localized protein n=1 Tax=Parasponia andersonii TaxID=3476 RepID=A0A2P5CR00_PARAD|nr:AT-hook motif nuclear-localised protein [Parasponia andersonii]
MFSKLHHSHHNQHHHQQQQQQQLHPFANPFQVTPSRECQTSEEDNTSRSSSGAAATATAQRPNSSNKPTSDANQPGDGATIEVVRRPRGRPPGSKNKPKPPVIITRDTEPAMSPYILEVPGGNDIVEAIARFCRRKNMGLCVLTGSGTVANVTLRQPSTTPGATVTFHGRFDILSITATFVPQTTPSCPVPNGFTISLAGPQGQIVGGLVAGALVAAGTVYVVAASFNNPSYHRLPAEDDARNSGSAEGLSPPLSGGAESGGHAPAESCGMSIYSLPSDVIWAPTARQPPPPPPPY